jgi:nitroimidazol reductase NimA-like FMN-containing flavoprotein (pyridoxamine 5'-phosphate oxidase superfamily)
MDASLKAKILELLGQHRIMTVATVRPDGWPQATTVGYASEGLTLYFLCGLDSQKAKNLALDNRLSLTIDHDTANVTQISGLSMAARAEPVTDHAEGERIMHMLASKYDAAANAGMAMPPPEAVRLFRVIPNVISVLDYSKGFAHTDLVEC